MKRIAWLGVSKSGTAWFDLGDFFSVDVGVLFIRLFMAARKWQFCRYLGRMRWEGLFEG